MLNLAHHHLWKRKLANKKSTQWTRFLDSFVYVVAFLAPLVTLPQVLKIFTEKNAGGLSVWSWTGYAVGSVVWLLYGIAHKEKPIILSNLPLVFLNAVIVVGILLYS